MRLNNAEARVSQSFGINQEERTNFNKLQR